MALARANVMLILSHRPCLAFTVMPKLYFRHGAVSSAKTLNLLAVAHNCRAQKKNVLIFKPQMDTRFGAEVVRSRAGLESTADVLVGADMVRYL